MIFSCKFRIANFSYLNSAYFCPATVIFSEDGNPSLVEIRGDHLAGYSNFQVEALDVQNQDLRWIPKDIGSFFPNIRVIQWINSNLWEISSADLWQFPNLMVLDLQKNKIVSLESSLFAFTPKILTMSFDSNLLYHVGEDLLTSLKFLKSVYIRNNPCINYYAVSGSEIEYLIKNLHIRCPPLPPQASTTTTTRLPATTTVLLSTTQTPNQCSAECLERIECLENKVAKHDQVIAELQKCLPCQH